jgi:hypothetical protein
MQKWPAKRRPKSKHSYNEWILLATSRGQVVIDTNNNLGLNIWDELWFCQNVTVFRKYQARIYTWSAVQYAKIRLKIVK